MSLLDTFARAVIWQGVREAAYEARRTRRGVVVHSRPAPKATPVQAADRETVVQFTCPKGHLWTVSFTDEGRPNERDFASARCPECRGPGHWLRLDYHRENDQ